MSRIGKNPVVVPSDVTVSINDNIVVAKGKLGELSFEFDKNEVETKLEENKIVINPLSSSNKARALWGTTRAQINNLIQGVSTGFTKELDIVGVGYRAKLQGSKLVLSLGFSHDIDFPIPEGVTVKCPTQTEVIISGSNKQQVGQVASKIRGYRPPEPYKGKGVKYKNEWILRKEGKKK